MGKISIASAGYGFVESAEGRFFIPSNRLNGAMNGDTVRIRPRNCDWRQNAKATKRSRDVRAPHASVDRVLERAHSTIVGMCVEYDDKMFIVPQDKRIDYLIAIVATPESIPAQGDIVVARMQTYPSRFELPSATIVEILGRDDDETIIEEIIAARNDIATKTPPELVEIANGVSVDIETALEEADRRDIRDRFILTIDPIDAKDFDDALSLELIDGDMRLGVHIADVSEYVSWGSEIDLDARRRATSTYFPGKVFPMIPPALSDDICSLRPGRDRLAFTVDMTLRQDCTVKSFEAYPSVINSSLRLDYDNVQRMFDGEADYPSPEAKEVLEGLRTVSRKLFKARIKRGSLDFESSELKVVLDADGKAIGVAKRVRTEATDLVEEAMILCNEVVAGCMLEAQVPFAYRVHEEPLPSSIEEAKAILRLFGYDDECNLALNSDMQRMLDLSKGKPHARIINDALLRSMKQAVYKSEYTTHFGLASKGYCHFTSPIRRYPDLIAHRLFREHLFNEGKRLGVIDANADKPMAIRDLDAMISSLPHLCEHCSTMERNAERASYEALDSKICEYMEQFIGDKFDATITDVRSFGFFVSLDNGVEGMVAIRSFDDWLEYDEECRELKNPDNIKQHYRLGQNVRVRLTAADKHSGKLDFAISK